MSGTPPPPASGDVASDTGVPAKGALVWLDGRLHRNLAVLDGRPLLVNAATDRIFLVQGEDDGIGLPSAGAWRGLVRQGRVRIQPDTGASNTRANPCGGDPALEALDTAIAMADRDAVRNGTKALLIWLHTAWTTDLQRRFGPPPSAHAIKRWRTARDRARANAVAEAPSDR